MSASTPSDQRHIKPKQIRQGLQAHREGRSLREISRTTGQPSARRSLAGTGGA